MSATATQVENEDRPRLLKTVLIIGALCTALAAITGFAKAWVILPYRLEQAEKQSEAIKVEQAQTAKDLREMKEMLIRIDEKVKKL